MESLLRSQISVLMAFKAVNPIKWDALVEDLKGFEFKEFGQGTALSNTGDQTPFLIAQKDENQWIYLPRQKHLVLKGTDPDRTISHFKEVRDRIQNQFSRRKWEKNFRFYEIHIIYEFEPNEISPMDIMRSIAPGTSLESFKKVFKGKKSAMYAFRLANWEAELPSNIREAVPWYEMTVQPMVENTDRIVSEILSRNRDLESVESTAERMKTAIFSFMERYDKGD